MLVTVSLPSRQSILPRRAWYGILAACGCVLGRGMSEICILQNLTILHLLRPNPMDGIQPTFCLAAADTHDACSLAISIEALPADAHDASPFACTG